jgi:uncharacterized membrane protein
MGAHFTALVECRVGACPTPLPGHETILNYSCVMLELPNGLIKRIALFGLVVFFTGVGVLHFIDPDSFVAIMPAYLPWHLELVYLSGVFEIGLGLGVLVPKLRVWAGYGLVVLLVAVYPANINMALNAEPFIADGVSLGFIYARLPFQFLFMAWAIWATRPDSVS